MSSVPKHPQPVVYIFRAKGTPFVKVGSAVNVKLRWVDVQVGCPHELEIRATFSFPSLVAARAAERQAHHYLRDRGLHHRGEWFQANGRELAAVCAVLLKLARAQQPGVEVKNRQLPIDYQPRGTLRALVRIRKDLETEDSSNA